MNSKDRFIHAWKHTRELGLVRFIIVNGVMAWGSTCALVMILFLYTIAQGDKTQLLPELFIWAVICPVGGIFWGLLVFYFNEGKYKELLDDPNQRRSSDRLPDENRGE